MSSFLLPLDHHFTNLPVEEKSWLLTLHCSLNFTRLCERCCMLATNVIIYSKCYWDHLRGLAVERLCSLLPLLLKRLYIILFMKNLICDPFLVFVSFFPKFTYLRVPLPQVHLGSDIDKLEPQLTCVCLKNESNTIKMWPMCISKSSNLFFGYITCEGIATWNEHLYVWLFVVCNTTNILSTINIYSSLAHRVWLIQSSGLWMSQSFREFKKITTVPGGNLHSSPILLMWHQLLFPLKGYQRVVHEWWCFH